MKEKITVKSIDEKLIMGQLKTYGLTDAIHYIKSLKKVIAKQEELLNMAIKKLNELKKLASEGIDD